MVLNTAVILKENAPEIKISRKPVTIDDLADDVQRLSNDKQKQILNLLNQFRNCVALDLSELGCTNLIQMDIQMKPDSEPCYSKPYPTNVAKREIIIDKVREWKDAKLLSETDSPYASPCLLLTKSDGSNRLVVDYRMLNKNTIRMHFPLPNLDDSLEDLQGATIFAVLDLAQRYLQIPLTEQAKEKTAFITQDETDQFERAIFGLMNAPFYFAKLMKKVFGPYGNNLALHYFDDILVYARNWEELLQKIEKILSLLEDPGLTLNIKKFRFGLESVEYLGYRIGNGGMSPGDKKVRAILEFPTPKNAADARSFHGVASFFRRFIPGFAGLCAPIIE